MSNLFGRAGWERIKVEVEKCVLLCAMCHRKEHYFIRKGEEQARLELLPKKPIGWPDSDLEVLRTLSGFSMKQIHSRLPHYSKKQLFRKCKELNLQVVSYKDRPWNAQEQELIKTYIESRKNLDEIHQLLKHSRSRNSIVKLLCELKLLVPRQKLGFSRNIPFIDFENLTSSTAYLLGLIWGKGAVDLKTGKAYINFQSSDWRERIIVRFNLRVTKNRLWIDNPKSIEQLIMLGLKCRTEQSTYTYPHIDSQWDRYFIRGYFDSKATITRTGALNTIFCGMPEVCLDIEKRFNAFYLHPIVSLHQNNKGKTMPVLELIYYQNMSHEFLNFIDVPLPIVSGKFDEAKQQIKQSRNVVWSEEEIELLKNNYQFCDKDTLKERLPGKEWHAIEYQKNKLGLRKEGVIWSRWTADDVIFLRDNNGKLTLDEFVTHFGQRHSRKSIEYKMRGLGIKTKKLEKYMWDEDILNQIKILKRDGHRVVDMAEMLPLDVGEVRKAIMYLRETLTWEEKVKYDILSLKERKIAVDQIITDY